MSYNERAKIIADKLARAWETLRDYASSYHWERRSCFIILFFVFYIIYVISYGTTQPAEAPIFCSRCKGKAFVRLKCLTVYSIELNWIFIYTFRTTWRMAGVKGSDHSCDQLHIMLIKSLYNRVVGKWLATGRKNTISFFQPLSRLTG